MQDIDDQGTLGPLTQKLFEFVWTKLLFVPGSKLYLPDIIKNGDPSRGLISYDPYIPGGASSPMEVNVPQSSRCTACMSLETPEIPIGKGKPTLVFQNIEIINLHAVAADGDLSFPPGYKVRAQFAFGTLQGQSLPFTVQPHIANENSFVFKQNCCEPVQPKVGQCDDETIANSVQCKTSWVNDGTGDFTAKVNKMLGMIEMTVDTSNLTIASVDFINIAFDPKSMEYDFNVDQSGGDLGKKAMLAFVDAAIKTGIANNMVQDEINNLANDQGFRDHIRTMVNEALQQALSGDDVEEFATICSVLD